MGFVFGPCTHKKINGIICCSFTFLFSLQGQSFNLLKKPTQIIWKYRGPTAMKFHDSMEVERDEDLLPFVSRQIKEPMLPLKDKWER